MNYTVLSASYANADHTAALILTEEAGAVLISHVDTPDLWADLESYPVADYDPPVEPFPAVVTAAQAKIALFNAGLLDQVKAVVAGYPYEVVRIFFSDAGVWERGNPYVQALGIEIGLTEEQMDDLFMSASRL